MLGVWLGLLGIEFCEEVGLFAFADEQTDQAADDAVESFGKAIPAEDRAQLVLAQSWSNELAIVQPSAPGSDLSPLFLGGRHRAAGTAPKQHVPIYTLYRDLRI